MPISKWKDQKSTVQLHDGIVCSRKNDGAPTFCDNLDGSGEDYAKWNKSGGKIHISYDLSSKWNLINKTNKQENISKDVEIKNKLTATRAEVGRDNGGNGERVVKQHV